MDNLTIKEVTLEELDRMCRPAYDEDKEKCVEQLFKLLKTTRSFHYSLTSMRYTTNEYGEYVLFDIEDIEGNVDIYKVNVTADSCVALIKDVWETIYEIA